MKSGIGALLLMSVLVIACSCYSWAAEVEWALQRTLKTEKSPIDVAVAPNGRYVFVLDEQGKILIYLPDGTLQDSITVGDSIDGIKPGPRDDILVLTSRKENTVQIITLDFIRDIDISGAPFKGAKQAPVVIAVFSDYQ